MDGRAYAVFEYGRVGGRLHPHDGRVRTHPSGVRPLVAVVDPLVVLRRQERQNILPVCDDEDRGLPPFEILLDDDPLPGGTELAGEGGPYGLFGLLAGDGHGNALARRGSIGLHHDRVVVVRAQVGEGRRLAVERLKTGRRYAGVAHELLGEDLRALYAGRGPRRTEDLQASLPESLGDTPYEWHLGTHDGQVDLVFGGVVPQRDQIVDRDVHRLGDARDADVTGDRVHLGLEGACGQGLDQRVLASTAPYHQHLQSPGLTTLYSDPLDDRLIPLRPDADHAQRSPDLGLDETDEVLRRSGKIPPHPAPRDVLAPACQRLVHGSCMMQIGLVHRVAFHALAGDLVAHADVYLLDGGEHIEERDGDMGDPVERSGPLDGGEI